MELVLIKLKVFKENEDQLSGSSVCGEFRETQKTEGRKQNHKLNKLRNSIADYRKEKKPYTSFSWRALMYCTILSLNEKINIVGFRSLMKNRFSEHISYILSFLAQILDCHFTMFQYIVQHLSPEEMFIV